MMTTEDPGTTGPACRPQGPRIHLACLLWQASLSAKAVPRQLARREGLPATPSHCPDCRWEGAATGGGLGSQL